MLKDYPCQQEFYDGLCPSCVSQGCNEACDVDSQLAYYYDQLTGTCESANFGTYTNSNHFSSLEECSIYCLGL